jgi:flagellar biosynthetic protein FliP
LKNRWHILTALALAVALGPAALCAQTSAPAPSGPAPAPSVLSSSASRPASATSLPAAGDVIKLIDKAVAPKDGANAEWSAPIRLAVVFTLLALLPSLLVMATSFTRIVIVLAFIRRALTTQTIPPTVALVGLAMFLTFFTMSPTISSINEQAVQPYLHDDMTFEQASDRGTRLLKEFMLRQTQAEDLALFVDSSGTAMPENLEDLPVHVVAPAFAVSEFRTAFSMGCLLFIPFLLVDLVVSGILLSAGMMMLPPSMVSLPFKIILFVLVDGWRLVAGSLIRSFH